MLIKLRGNIAWTEQLRFNYLVGMLLLMDKEVAEPDGTRPVSSANLGRFIASEQNLYFCEYIKQTVNICVY